MGPTFACPSDCGWCCTHLEREPSPEEREATAFFRDVMREQGVYHCADKPHIGLSLSPAEAAALREESEARGMRVRLHPRTYLLETRRRVAVVLDWHLPYASCPFYSDFKCTAYDKRPLVCRAYPVMAPAPRWSLAPECPKVEPVLEARRSGSLKLGLFLRGEAVARRTIDEAHARLDADAMAILETPGARFAKALGIREAGERLKRYRVVTPDEFEEMEAR